MTTKNHNNVFSSIFKCIEKMEKDHSETAMKKEEEKFERKISRKEFRPVHTRILMREKTKDEYDKVSKEVKYSSFIGLDEYGKANSAVGRNGITRDSAVTRFNKKKTAKNLAAYIPTCGYEIDIESGGDITRLGDIRDLEKILIPSSEEKDSCNQITDAVITPMVQEIMRLIEDYDNARYYNVEEKLMEYVNNIDKLKLLENTLLTKKFDYIFNRFKEIYSEEDNIRNRTAELDDYYGVYSYILPLVRNHCSMLDRNEQIQISSMLKGLSTYSSREEIRSSYYQVIVYMLSTCTSNHTVEELFDSFTLLIPPQFQAIVMAEVAFIKRSDIDIIYNVLDEFANLLKSYIEVLPTKVETLFIYLDRVYECRSVNVDKDHFSDLIDWRNNKFTDEEVYEDILKLVPLDENLEKLHPAIYKMLHDIAEKVNQYKTLF